MKNALKGIAVFFLFLVLLGIRTWWDSHRFYEAGKRAEQTSHIAEAIRYYGNSHSACPLFSSYSEKSRLRLKELRNSVSDERLQLMIDDELKQCRGGRK